MLYDEVFPLRYVLPIRFAYRRWRWLPMRLHDACMSRSMLMFMFILVGHSESIALASAIAMAINDVYWRW